ncbi:hypothetical protein [Labilibaculum euxinus]
MSEQENYDSSLEEIQASVKNEGIKHCSMPVGMYIAEIKSIIHVAKQDLPQLISVGYQSEKLEKLEILTGALTVALSIWATEATSKAEALKKWQENAPAMHNLIRDLYDNMRFAFRNHKDLIQILDEINEGDSNSDSVMDLAKLGRLGNNHAELLTAIGYEMTQCSKALSESERMSAILAEVNGSFYVDDEKKVIRDKSYTLVKRYADELKDYGKFVFRKDEDHAQLYTSKYLRNKKSEYRKNKENAAADIPEETIS